MLYLGKISHLCHCRGHCLLSPTSDAGGCKNLFPQFSLITKHLSCLIPLDHNSQPTTALHPDLQLLLQGLLRFSSAIPCHALGTPRSPICANLPCFCLSHPDPPSLLVTANSPVLPIQVGSPLALPRQGSLPDSLHPATDPHGDIHQKPLCSRIWGPASSNLPDPALGPRVNLASPRCRGELQPPPSWLQPPSSGKEPFKTVPSPLETAAASPSAPAGEEDPPHPPPPHLSD